MGGASQRVVFSSARLARVLLPGPDLVAAFPAPGHSRFVKPVAIGDSIQVRLTCKRKIDRNRKDANGQGQGVVAWDVEVKNQHGELVASYDILTLVSKKGFEFNSKP